MSAGVSSPKADAKNPLDTFAYDDFTPVFYVGHHESKRALPVSDFALRQALDVGYDMLTTPITTPNFHSRVLSLLAAHLTADQSSDISNRNAPPAPIIPPFNAVDTPLSPGDTVSQLIGYCSPWIDLCSPDPLISNLSRQVLTMEVAYAAFCGVGNIIIPGPRSHRVTRDDSGGLTQYSRAVQEALTVGPYVQMAIHLPMYPGDAHIREPIGDLMPLARGEYYSAGKSETEIDEDLYGSWDSWNLVRSISLALPRQLPSDALQSRWFAEPLRLLTFAPSTFLKNVSGHPVLGKAHQSLITRYMRLKQAPWLLLCDVSPIPDPHCSNQAVETADGFAIPSVVADVGSPTPAEAAQNLNKESIKEKPKAKESTAHLIYIRFLQRKQPPRSTLERFGSGYQDYLQTPLQPLTDNLESVTYEVFEKDPVKYDWYERAIAQALTDWKRQGQPTSSPNGAVVVAVAGSGRGPLVTRALRASRATGIPIEAWAVEKNPNAYVLLQRHNEDDWDGAVNIVKSDMRAWKGPVRSSSSRAGQTSAPPSYGKVDILVSELLGSFADNELSPECLDGVQHVLSTPHGISIPSSYTAHVTPILAPRLHADISHRALTDNTATDTPYVVMLHQIDYLATSVPDFPRIQQAWEFVHPLPPSTLAIAEMRRGGGVSGGGGGSMAGGDGANEHNARYSRIKFVCKERGVVHGLAGYFEAVLYDGGAQGVGKVVELSTRPDTIQQKSKDMISWFPIYFPLKNPLYFPDDAELEVSIWRQTDDRKVWYEWLVEAFVMLGPKSRVRVGMSEAGSSRKNGCLM
ncbi:MAG: methyltransferase protein [Claussenomyces sp. TS43310]|nr:MAG: methyltransferase protein [Claussenomyces sp. TS43310]